MRIAWSEELQMAIAKGASDEIDFFRSALQAKAAAIRAPMAVN